MKNKNKYMKMWSTALTVLSKVIILLSLLMAKLDQEKPILYLEIILLKVTYLIQ